MSNEPAFIIKKGIAAKTGPRSTGTGGIDYQLLTDQHHTELFLRITGNSSSGYVSPEVTSFTSLTTCLKEVEAGRSFPARVFKKAFKTRNANQPGFTAACLRAEGLLTASVESPSQHVQSGDWKSWLTAMLKQPGEVYVPATTTTAKDKVSGPVVEAKDKTITDSVVPKSDSTRSKRKSAQKEEDKQALPSTEETGNAGHQA